jgi:hypothetical protein
MNIQSQSTQSTETPMEKTIVIESRHTTPVTEEEDITSPIATSPVRSPIQSRRSTPVIGSSGPIRSQRSTPVTSDVSPTGQRTRRSTPIIGNISPIGTQRTSTGKQKMYGTDTSAPQPSNNIESILVKQGKQIRALYELQKATFEKVSTIQKEMKKLTNKNVELSSKVLNVSNHNLV